MNSLKFIAISCLSLLACVAAHAQNPGLYNLGNFTGGTNRVATFSTNNPVGAVLNVSEFDACGLTVSAVGSNSVVSSITFRFVEAMDGTYATTPQHVLVLPLDSTNTTTINTNLPLLGTGSLKLYSIENPNVTNLVTNITVRVRLKAPKVRTL